MLHRVGRDFTPPEFQDVRVLVYGDAALMTSRTILHTSFDGRNWSGEYFLTDVWVRRDGRWQLVRRHSSGVVLGAS
jgi:ketosteroid isomerase-like protein